MSGGFFRGTSAEQDTRFSNKHAKLLKTQKFSSELEHLVDMTKVKMDVIRPWIATRVTELLGFEDEVLINFIYGLLDGKEVNGKEVQIQLTGFMEKNTGKFMKELWTLLLSAQKNASGVPQQFLDAKEAETKKKKEEADRLANEIGKRRERENRELEHDRLKKMDGGVDQKATSATMETKSLNEHPEDEKRADEKNGVKERRRDPISPRRRDVSPSSLRGSRSRSISKANSGSRNSEPKSRSLSGSPEASVSPIRRRSLHTRQRSRSRSSRSSLSPGQRRVHSSYQSRSPSPVRRRRLPSPVRRRRSPSPVRRRRTPSPVRHRRSPPPARRHRSPSPSRYRRSPSPDGRHLKSRSPSMQRRLRSPGRPRRLPSPGRRPRSPSLDRRHRSPSSIRRGRSPTPLRHRGSLSPGRHGKSTSAKRRGSSPSPIRRSSSLSPTVCGKSPPNVGRQVSPSPRRRGSPSPPMRRRRSPTPAKGQGSLSPARLHTSSSPIRRRASPSPAPSNRKRRGSPPPVAHRGRSPLPLCQKSRSPVWDRSPGPVREWPYSPARSISPARNKSLSPRRHESQSNLRRGPPSTSPVGQHNQRSPSISRQELRSTLAYRSANENRRRHSSSRSRSISRSHSSTPVRHMSPVPAGRKSQKDRRSPGQPSEEINREDRDYKSRPSKKQSLLSSDTGNLKESPEKLKEGGGHVERVKEQEKESEKLSWRHASQKSPDSQMCPVSKDSSRVQNSDDKKRPHPNGWEDVEQDEKVNNNDLSENCSSDSKGSIKHRAKNKKRRKLKRSERDEGISSDDDSYDSEVEHRKEAKRRKKEEKKLRKEEKKRRREERRRRREERRAEKLKMKQRDHSDTSDGEHVSREESHPKHKGGGDSDPKKLEIELRNKALESLKAKKGINH